MSIYTECSQAARSLLSNPRLRIMSRSGPAGIFTELDVIMLAARDAGGYTAEAMKVAQREASQVMGTLFRDGKVVRFGPVKMAGLKELDYARMASKIIYASPELENLETPNGTFPQMFADNDPIGRQGRRLGASRNDLEPWENQDIVKQAPGKPTTADQRRIARLEAELAAANARAEHAVAELHRLREHGASLTVEDVEEIVARRIGDSESKRPAA